MWHDNPFSLSFLYYSLNYSETLPSASCRNGCHKQDSSSCPFRAGCWGNGGEQEPLRCSPTEQKATKSSQRWNGRDLEGHRSLFPRIRTWTFTCHFPAGAFCQASRRRTYRKSSRQISEPLRIWTVTWPWRCSVWLSLVNRKFALTTIKRFLYS